MDTSHASQTDRAVKRDDVAARLSQTVPTSPVKSPGKTNQADDVLRLKARAEMLSRKMDSASRQMSSLGRANEVASWGENDRKDLMARWSTGSRAVARGPKASLSPKAADLGKFLPSSSSDSDDESSSQRSLDRHGLRKLRRKLQEAASSTPDASQAAFLRCAHGPSILPRAWVWVCVCVLCVCVLSGVWQKVSRLNPACPVSPPCCLPQGD